MINAIIEALNYDSKEGFYVLHKELKPSAIKSAQIIHYRLYYIQNDFKNQVFSYMRVIKKADYNEELQKNLDKEFVKNLVLAIKHKVV